MELSGYAMLMQELRGTGIWDQVRAQWDSLLAGAGATELVAQLAGTLRARATLFALTPGGLERTNRAMRLNSTLQEAGVTVSRYSSPFDRERKLTHRSPLVGAFARADTGAEDLANLFLVEYLLTKVLPGTIELPLRARSLQQRIEAARQQLAKQEAPMQSPLNESNPDSSAENGGRP
jgi:hypothetical protein